LKSGDKYLVELLDGQSASMLETNFLGHPILNRYVAVFNGYSMTLTIEDAEKLSQSGLVKRVQRVNQFKIHGVQTNPRWNLDWADQTTKRIDHRYSYRATGKGVVVYTIDSGVLTTHPEFEGRAHAGIDISTDRGTSLENIDGYGHGTHVAGLVGSKTYGIAKEVEIVAVKVFNSKGETTDTDTVLSGLDWILLDKAQRKVPAVVNMSLGGAGDDVLDGAIRKLIAEGLTVVVSAGNDNSPACSFSPAREPQAITVTSIQSNGLRPLYANFGRCVDIIAPGEGVTSTWKNGKTEIWGGTSQAAPQVSGAAAIYLEEHSTARQEEIEKFLISKSVTKGMFAFPKGTPHQLLNMAWNLP
jgi:subtilisin family serine protease